MLSVELQKYISRIKGLDHSAVEAARIRQQSLAKPPGSLGMLEDIAVTLAGIGGGLYYDTSKRCVIVMSADNGVVEEGVSSAPQSVTYAQTVNMSRGLTGVAVIAKQFGADLIVVDTGVNADIDSPLIKNRKIRKSTFNIARREAMTYDEALTAVLTGIETAVDAVNDGYTMIGAGEMGIGNTTTSAAVLCALTGIEPEQAAGKGGGLTEDAYARKLKAIRLALNINKPDPADPVDVLSKVGGFDIAAMAGVFIGGAYMRVPVVIDGFISIVAALLAAGLCPAAKEFMFASHSSFEPGFLHAANALGKKPCLELGMRLGEGSGCPLMFAVIDAACAVMKNMATFEEARIDDGYLDEIRRGDCFTVAKA